MINNNENLMKEEEGRNQKSVIEGFFKDQNLTNLLNIQISQIYAKFPQHQFCTEIRGERLYIKIKKIKGKQNKICEYVIRVTKNFPQFGISLFSYSDHLHPQISDTRDLSFYMFPKGWNYTNHLFEIIENLDNLEIQLQRRNNKFFLLEGFGNFKGKDQFTFEELKNFKSLSIYQNKDKQSKENIIVCLSYTHLLVFTQQKQNQTELFQRALVAPLDAIEKINHHHQTGIIQIKIYRWLLVKEKKQKFWMFFTFNESEKFIGDILKKQGEIPYIVNSTIQMGNQWSEDKKILQKIQKCNKMEQKYFSSKGWKEDEKKLLELSQIYNQLIVIFASILSPYHIIYVNKLQKVYSLLYPSQG